MIKFFIVLSLVGFMFAFTGCDKPKEVKAVAIEEQVYTQESKAVVKTEKAEAVKEEAKAEKAKPAKKAKKAAKAKEAKAAKK